MSYTDDQREETIAMIHLDTWGSTSYPPVRWERWRFAETDYAPEWLSESDLGCEHDQCVTVLDYSLRDPVIPEGYRVAYQYQAGEKECPDCRPDDHEEDYEGQPKRSECTLCEQSGYIYSGEECVVLVLAPRYSYGSGMSGCLYDNGPHVATSIADATASLLETFADQLEEGEEARLAANLLESGIHYFEKPEEAGAQYCEVTDLRGQS